MGLGGSCLRLGRIRLAGRNGWEKWLGEMSGTGECRSAPFDVGDGLSAFVVAW